jgi:hypothetical protein
MTVPLAADLTAAWFGIGGVVVGAIATAGIAYLTERRQEHRDYQLALKLTSAEIDEISRIAAKALKAKKWPLGMASKNWAQSWSTNRRALAGKLDETAFRAVAVAYGFAEQIQSGLAAGDKAFRPPRPGEQRGPDEIFFTDVKAAFEAAATEINR